MTSAPRPPSHSARILPAWMWACALFLLLAVAPLLGAIHAVVHAPTAPSVVHGGDFAKVASDLANTFAATQTTARADERAYAHSHATGGLQQLFGDHSRQGDCRIYDQLCHADGLQSAPVSVAPLLPPAWLQAWWLGETLFRWTALFDARGPPSAR